MDRYCLKKGITHNLTAAEVALGNRSGLGNTGWKWRGEWGEKIRVVVGKNGEQEATLMGGTDNSC